MTEYLDALKEIKLWIIGLLLVDVVIIMLIIFYTELKE